jgi:hypothetical protein
MVLRALFQEILTAITALRPLPPADVEDQRQTWPIWLSAGTGVPTQACGPHLAHTVFVDQGFRRRPSELTVAERPVWWLSYLRGD